MNIRDQLILHERLRLKPYLDTVGKLTIGVGRNLTDKGISRSEAFMLLDNDIAACEFQLAPRIDRFEFLNEVRRRVLIDMCFNLGIGGLLGFRHMLAALDRADFSTAADEMLSSKWADQVGTRAQRLAKMMREGKDAD